MLAATFLPTAIHAGDSSSPAYFRSSSRGPADPIVPNSNTVYQIVLDLSDARTDGTVVHPGIKAVESLIAQYASYGVAADRRHFALIIHGDEVDIALADASFSKRNNGRQNINATALQHLMKQGVLVIVSMESLGRRGIRPEELASGIRTAPTANMALIDFENDGFVYSSTRSLGGE